MTSEQMPSEQEQSLEATEARIEYPRSEIRRCDKAIEDGPSDNWWFIDRDRLRTELASLTERTPTPAVNADKALMPDAAVGLAGVIADQFGFSEAQELRLIGMITPWLTTPTPVEEPEKGATGENITRTMSREFWRGVPVVAYHWPINEPEHPIEGLRERHGIAYHWSTGPEGATRLVSADDAERLLAATNAGQARAVAALHPTQMEQSAVEGEAS